jgi:hypothetical protein
MPANECRLTTADWLLCPAPLILSFEKQELRLILCQLYREEFAPCEKWF